MTKKGLTEIVFILDKSGSMWGIKQDAIGGFNSFVEEQKKLDGEAKMTLVLFSSSCYKTPSHQVVFEGRDINEVELLSEETFIPSGGTALLDTIGNMIDSVGNRLSKTHEDEKPENVVFAILTDGQENSSREYTRSIIMDKISHQTDKYNWQFIYLGANQDAIGEATSLGIKGIHAGNFVADGFGTKSAILNASEMVMSYRSTGQMMSYMDAEIKNSVQIMGDSIKASSETIGESLKSVLKKVEGKE